MWHDLCGSIDTHFDPPLRPAMASEISLRASAAMLDVLIGRGLPQGVVNRGIKVHATGLVLGSAVAGIVFGLRFGAIAKVSGRVH